METPRTNVLDFWEKYQLISSSENFKDSPTKKSDCCRFCGRDRNEVTFIQDTHLIPELLGENGILTMDECDTCNNLFSDYESNLAIFIRPYITLLGIKGKKKIPIFQSRTKNRDEETRTIVKHTLEGNREIHLKQLDDYNIDRENKTLDLVFRKPSFIPVKVYKALVKIGLSLLPREYDKFNAETFEWLINKKEDLSFIRNAYVSVLKRNYFLTPSADLYRAKKIVNGNIEYPEHILVVCFANIVFQIFMPFSEEMGLVHDPSRQLELNLFPSIAYENIEKVRTAEIKIYDLGISEHVFEDETISFSFENAELNIKRNEV